MFINRDWSRSEDSDFVLNVSPYLGCNLEAVGLYAEGIIFGWVIQERYS